MEAALPTEVPGWLTEWMDRLERKVDKIAEQTRSYNPDHCRDQDVVLRALQDESAARTGSSKTVELSRAWILAFVSVVSLAIAAAAYAMRAGS